MPLSKEQLDYIKLNNMNPEWFKGMTDTELQGVGLPSATVATPATVTPEPSPTPTTVPKLNLEEGDVQGMQAFESGLELSAAAAEVAAEERRDPDYEELTARTMPTEGLQAAIGSFIESNSYDMYGVYSVELEAKARKDAERLINQAFTQGGEPSMMGGALDMLSAMETKPGTFGGDMQYYVDHPDATKAGVAGAAAAFFPQTIQTKEQARRSRRAKAEAESLAVIQLKNKLMLDWNAATEYSADGEDAIETLQSKKIKKQLDMLEEGGVPDSDVRFMIRVRAQDILKGEVPWEPMYDVMQGETGVPVGNFVDEAEWMGRHAAEHYFTRTNDEGAVTESGLSVGARLLAAPISALVGVGEAAVTDKPMTETIPTQMQRGLGGMGGGLDIADAVAEATGVSEEAHQTLRYIGGGSGLAVDFLLPIFPLARAATATVRGAATGYQATRGVGYGVGRSALQGLKGAARAGAPALADDFGYWAVRAYRGKPAGAPDVVSDSIRYFANDPANQKLAGTWWKFLDELDDTALKAELQEMHNARVIAAKEAGLPEPVMDFSENISAVHARHSVMNDGAGDAISARINAAYNKANTDGSTSTVQEFFKSAEGKGFETNFQGRQSLRTKSNQLYHRAALDESLSQETKTQLYGHGAASQERIATEITAWLEDLPLNEARLIHANLPAKLRARIKLSEGDASIGKPTTAQMTIDNVKPLTTGGIPTGAKKALTRNVLYHVGRDAIDNPERFSFIMPGADRMRRISTQSFIPEAAAVKLEEKIRGSVIGRVSGEIAQSGARRSLLQTETLIKLSPEETSELLDLLTHAQGRGIAQEKLRRIIGPLEEGAGPSTTLSIEPKQWNKLVNEVIDSQAQTIAGYRSLDDMGKTFGRLSKADGDTVMQGLKKGLAREDYTAKILTPKEVAGGTLETVLKAGVKYNTQRGTNPVTREITSQISERFGGMSEDFKMQVRRARAEGKSAPDAWAEVVVKNYTRHLDEQGVKQQFIDSFPDDEAMALIRYNRLLEDNYEAMANDFIALIFGGTDTLSPTLTTAGSRGAMRGLDGSLLLPAEYSQMSMLIAQHPTVKPLIEGFMRASVDGDYLAALTELRNIQAQVSGRSMQQILADPKTGTMEVYMNPIVAERTGHSLQELYGKAKEAAVGDARLNAWSSGDYTPNQRGIKEMFDQGAEDAAMYPLSAHLDLVSGQYLVRRQAAIIRNTYENWSGSHPDLFPNAAALGRLSDTFQHRLKPMSEGMYRYKQYSTRGFDSPTDQAKWKGSSTFGWLGHVEALKGTHHTTIDATKALGVSGGKPFSDMLNIERLIQEELFGSHFNHIFMGTLLDEIAVRGTNVGARRFEQLKWALTRAETDVARDEILRGDINQVLKNTGYIVDDLTGAEMSDLFKQYFTRVLHDDEILGNIKAASGSDDYLNALMPTFRAENNKLFYDTMSSAYRSALTSDSLVITQSPATYIDQLSLLGAESAALKKSLMNTSNIERWVDSLEKLKLHSTQRKLSPEQVSKIRTAGGDLPNDVTAQAQKMVEAGLVELKTLEPKFGSRLHKAYSDVFSVEFFSSSGLPSRVAKGGVLGGGLLPNFRYLMANKLTGPAIVYSTLGPEYAAMAAKGGVYFADAGVASTMQALTSQRFIALDVAATYKAAKMEVVVVSPTGKIYTNYDLADMVAGQGIARSQASAELTNDVLSELTSWSGLKTTDLFNRKLFDPNGKYGTHWMGKHLRAMPDDMQRFVQTTWLPQYTEAGRKATVLFDAVGDAKRGEAFIPDQLAGQRKMNIFSEWANFTDTRYRVSVLKHSLGKGMAEEAAMKLARESLFDYGALTSVEKNYINKVFWFWTFRRSNYRALAKNMLTNPARLKNMYRATHFLSDADIEPSISTADYTDSRPFVEMVQDTGNKKRYALYGPSTPNLEAAADLIDVMSFALVTMNGSQALSQVSDYTKPVVDTLSTSVTMANPMIKLATGLVFNVDPRDPQRKLGGYLHPNLMWYLQQNPETWETFSSYVRVEPVPIEDEVAGRGTYQGKQWRINRKDKVSIKNWFALQNALLNVGIVRNLRDYAPLWAAINTDPLSTDRPENYWSSPEGKSDILAAMMYTGGVLTPVNELTLEERIQHNLRTLKWDLQDASLKKPKKDD
tara:strand:- start:574 stop:6975 length:6402 start_codon:yes stop_codon:yes gene_type:complete